MRKRKILGVLLAVSMLFTSACSQPQTVDDEDDEIVAEYIDNAKRYYKNGKIDKAISELEEGLDETDSPKIERLLSRYRKEKESYTDTGADTTTGSSEEFDMFGNIFGGSTTTAEAYMTAAPADTIATIAGEALDTTAAANTTTAYDDYYYGTTAATTDYYYDDDDVLTILSWEGNSDAAKMVDFFCKTKGYDSSKVVLKGLGENGSAARDAYKQYLQGDGDADIMYCEDGWIQEYVNDNSLTAPLSDIGLYKSDFPDAYPHVLAYCTSTGGVLKGNSWQACPGAFVYRNDLAKDLLGVNSPDEMQALISDWDKFEATAQKVSDNSQGATALQATMNGLWEAFKCNRSKPWVVDGKLEIDTAADYYDLAKEFKDKGWCADVPQWDNAWYAAMQDGTAMGEFVPSWGLTSNAGSIIANFTKDGELGDKFSICPGPTGWYWGGVYLCLSEKCNSKGLAKEFFEFYCRNDDTMRYYAEEYDDFVNNKAVMDSFTYSNSYVNGENHYALLARSLASMDPDGVAVSPYDTTIKDCFKTSVEGYVKGTFTTKDEAIGSFMNEVVLRLGNQVLVD